MSLKLLNARWIVTMTPGSPVLEHHTLVIEGERIGVKLTESFAMWPGSSVSGLYLSHPEAHYFGLGKITKEQIENYAQRKNMKTEEAEKWLGTVLGY